MSCGPTIITGIKVVEGMDGALTDSVFQLIEPVGRDYENQCVLVQMPTKGRLAADFAHCIAEHHPGDTQHLVTGDKAIQISESIQPTETDHQCSAARLAGLIQAGPYFIAAGETRYGILGRKRGGTSQRVANAEAQLLDIKGFGDVIKAA